MGVLGRAEQHYQSRSSSGIGNLISSVSRWSRPKKFAVLLSALTLIGVGPAAAVALHQDSIPNPSPGHDNSSLLESNSSSQSELNAASNNATNDGTNSVSSGNASNSSSTEVTVNGQSIPVPENGTVQKTMPTNNGQGTVNVKIDSHSSSSTSGNKTSTNLQVYSNSTSTGSTSINGFNDRLSEHR